MEEQPTNRLGFMIEKMALVVGLDIKVVQPDLTIVDPGEVTFSIWYIPDEASHRNSADSTGVSAGLRYLLINRLLRPWEATYPADPNGGTPTDTYQAFVTSFSVKGKVAGAFEADIALGINDQNPQFC